VRGTNVTYDARKRRLTCGKHAAPLAPEAGKLRLHILADEGSVEVFGNGGRVALSAGVNPKDGDTPVEMFARGGAARVTAVTVWELKSAWAK
jgi:sucrose-6-phosphate hydrolase SacC (GH32 family)